MTDQELETLLDHPETDRVERKESLADREKIRETICAFANDLPGHGRPGVLFIGVRDDGRCAELPITDELLLTLASIRDSGLIQPFPEMVVERRILRGCTVAVVIVRPCPAPPVRYNGRTCIRVGPRRGIASAEEERRLTERRRGGDLPFELRPMARATIRDLDLELFTRTYLPSAIAPDVLQENGRSIEDQLASLRFLTPEGAPTALGILVIGKAPTDFLPGATVQFLRIDGAELSDPILLEQRLDGPLIDQLRQIDILLKLNIRERVDVVSADLERRTPDYPLGALQQLVRNALLHRTYEWSRAPVRIHWFADRVEIASPGGPYGQVTSSNFGRPNMTDYRNVYLAEALKALGYAQRFGVGIATARRELEKNGHPPPAFEVDETHVGVTVWGRA